MHRLRLVVVGIVALELLLARHASAQTSPPFEVGVGYQFRHLSFDGAGVTFATGFYADAGRIFLDDGKRAWSWIGQFDGSFRSEEGLSEQLFTVLGGIRLAPSKPLKWTPSVNGLIGFGRLNASCENFCGGSSEGPAFEGAFFLSTDIGDRTALTFGFKATKMKPPSGGIFNAVVAAGIRRDF